MIHSVVLWMTWLIESAASGYPASPGRASRAGTAGGRRSCRRQAGGRGKSFTGWCLHREHGLDAGAGAGPRGQARD